MLTKRLINLPTTVASSARCFTTTINNIPNFKLPALPATDKVPAKLLTPYQEDGTFFSINGGNKESKYLVKQLFSLYSKPYYDSTIKTEALTDLTWFPEEFKLNDNDIKSIDQILAKLGSNNSQELYSELKLNFGALDNFGLVINYAIFNFNKLDLATELIAFYLTDGQNSEVGFNTNVNSFCFGKWLKYYVRAEEFDKVLAINEAALHFNIPQTPLYTKYFTLALAHDGKMEEVLELLQQLEQAKVELSQSYYLTLFEYSNKFQNTKLSVYIWKRMLAKFKMTNSQPKDQLSSKAYLLRLDNLTSFTELETIMRWITTRNLWGDDDLKLKFLTTFQKFTQQLCKGKEIEPTNLKYEFTKFNTEAVPIYLLNGWLNYHIKGELPSDKYKFVEFIHLLTEIATLTKSNAFLMEIVQNNLERISKLSSEEQTSVVYSTLKCLKQNPNTYHSGWLAKYKGLLEKFKSLSLEEELMLKIELLIKQ